MHRADERVLSPSSVGDALSSSIGDFSEGACIPPERDKPRAPALSDLALFASFTFTCNAKDNGRSWLPSTRQCGEFDDVGPAFLHCVTQCVGGLKKLSGVPRVSKQALITFLLTPERCPDLSANRGDNSGARGANNGAILPAPAASPIAPSCTERRKNGVQRNARTPKTGRTIGTILH